MENPISGEVQSQESCYGARFRRQADRCVPRWSPSEEEKGEGGALMTILVPRYRHARVGRQESR